MPPKRVKSGTAAGAAASTGNKSWESGLVAAQFEEDSWKADVSLVVGARPEDEESVRALVLAVQLPARRLFTVITWEDTLEKIHELGNPKAKKPKDLPMFHEVMESAKAVLDEGAELPAHLLGKVVKFQLLVAKGNDLLRRTTEQKVAEEKGKGKPRAGSPSKEKGGAAAKAAGKGEKGKKASEPPAPAPAKETKLKRRGEGEEAFKPIDDEPDDGPQLYVLMMGFLQPQLVAALDQLGIRVSNVIRVSSSNRLDPPQNQPQNELQQDPRNLPENPPQNELQQEPQNPPQNDPAPGTSPAPQGPESGRERLRAQMARFWRYLDPVLSSGPAGSRLWNVARLQYSVAEPLPDPETNTPQARLAFGLHVFEGVACLIYDCLDWRRQHLHYLSSLKLIQVPVVARGNAPSRQESAGQGSVKADPQTPKASSASKQKPIPDEPAAVAPPVAAVECDMQYYRDLLDLFPPETVSVPIILHCLREQVVATLEQIPPPSSATPKLRPNGLEPLLADHMIAAALSLGLSEEEEQRLLADFGVEGRGLQEEEVQRPLLFNSHDERSMRLQRLPVHCGMDAVQLEERMWRSGAVWRSLWRSETQSETRRLARAQELLHHCTDESLSWAEVQWAFRQFVFENMHLSQVEGRGLEPPTPPLIPWDDPVSFIQHIRAQRASQNAEEHAHGEVESRNDPTGSELKEEGSVEKQTSGVNIADIRRTWARSLSDWHITEHHPTHVFPQVLEKACESYSRVDVLQGVQDKAMFLVCHNPMSPQRHSKELWDMALHTDVGFRHYLAHVAESISDWTNQEEARWLALQKEKEREAELVSAPTPSQHSGVSRKRSRGSPKRSMSGRAASPAKSLCPEEPVRELHVRPESLKAWKMEQDRQREEELAKKWKKEKEKERRGGSKAGDRSPSSRASKKSPPSGRRKKEAVRKTPEPAAPPEDRRTEAQPAPEEPRGFTGYCMGGELLQVWGCRETLFPSDGGLIQVESTQFTRGSTMVKVCLRKDGHCFYTHVTEPRREGGANDDDIITLPGGGESRAWPVSRFGSFSAQLENGIRLSYSHHGQSGESTEEKDPSLAAVLDVQPPHTPSPAPSSAPSHSPSGKHRKSTKGHRAKPTPPSLAPAPAPAEREGETQGTPPCTQGGSEKAVLPEAQTPPHCLNACTPHGLLVQFLSTRAPGVEAELGGVMVRQNFLAGGWGQAKGLSQTRGRSLPGGRSKAGGRILPGGRSQAGGCSKAGRRDLTLALESSRLITRHGTVIRHLRDGSTQVLFADGTVSSSPVPAPVSKTPPTPPSPPDPPAQEEEVRGERSEVKEPAEEKGKQSSKPHMAATATSKMEGAELSDQGGAKQDGPEQGGATQSCDRTWVTTMPPGLRVTTTGSTVVPTPPLLSYTATDPMTGTVMLTREDGVVMVQEEGGAFTVEHADGTRISTFYQEEEPPPTDHLETGEEVVLVTWKQKLVRVECEGFVTVVMSCEEGTCSARLGEDTIVTAHPHGAYQVFPSGGGELCIYGDGTATYASHPGPSSALTPAGQRAELQPGCYTMSHTSDVICEVTDPEGSLFQVMVDGETTAVVSSREDDSEQGREEEEEEEEGEDEEKEEQLKFPCVRYEEHAPRFFVVQEDGSGTELLRSCEVEHLLSAARSDPSIAVLKEPIPELQGVWGITVLRPGSKDLWSRWMTPKPSDDIIPPNLRSRRWDTFLARERKTLGPTFGSTLGRGLYLKDRPKPHPPSPVLTCPEVLEVRQLIQYRPISKRLRRRLERRLQAFLEQLLQRELGWEEEQLKEPRTEEEKIHAADLLQLVLSLPDCESPADALQRKLSAVDVASLYTHSISSVLEDSETPSKEEEELTDGQELAEAEECRLAVREGIVPPYFSPDIGHPSLLTAEVPDMEALSRNLPPSPRQQENSEILEFLGDAPEPASRRPSNPTPSQATGGHAPPAGRPANPTPQAAAPPRPRSAPGFNSALRPHSAPGRIPLPIGPVAPSLAPDPAPSQAPDPAPSPAPDPTPSPAPGPQEPLSLPGGGASLMELHPEGGGAGLRTRALDAAGNPRREGLKLPPAILSGKPCSRPNHRFLSVEEPVRRKVRTVSVCRSLTDGVLRPPPRGFQLLPAGVDFGVLREGYTYCVTVVMKNVGVDSCRFSVKQPPPATGLKVVYTPGPVAAGLKTGLQVELFAMATGLEESAGEGAVLHYIQIHTETEILYLPVSAIVLPGDLFDRRDPLGGARVQVGGAKVRLVSTTPSVQRGVVRPHRLTNRTDHGLPLVA